MGWRDAPEVAAPATPKWATSPEVAPAAATPGAGDAIRRGLTQGATAGYGDEITGGVAAPILRLIGRYSNNPAYQNAFGNKSLPDLYRQSRDRERTDNAASMAANPKTFLASELSGGLLSSAAPGMKFLNVGPGATASTAIAKGAGLGALAGLGGSQADLTKGEVGGALGDTALGAGLGAGVGAAAHGLGSLFGRLRGAASQKVAGIDETVARKAAEEAAAATASARSAAGSAAQDAYRQLEHLRELGRLGKLAPEQQAAADALAQELGGKAEEKLLPAIARKQAAAAAFSEAAQSEGKRAEQLAADKLGTAELKEQVGARLKRYGLPAVAGAALGGMGFGGHGALAGAALGGALGNNFRPMMHSLIRLGKSPVVQRALMSTVAGGAEAAQPLMERTGGAFIRGADPEIETLIRALRRRTPAPTDLVAQGEGQ